MSTNRWRPPRAGGGGGEAIEKRNNVAKSAKGAVELVEQGSASLLLFPYRIKGASELPSDGGWWNAHPISVRVRELFKRYGDGGFTRQVNAKAGDHRLWIDQIASRSRFGTGPRIARCRITTRGRVRGRPCHPGRARCDGGLRGIESLFRACRVRRETGRWAKYGRRSRGRVRSGRYRAGGGRNPWSGNRGRAATRRGRCSCRRRRWQRDGALGSRRRSGARRDRARRWHSNGQGEGPCSLSNCVLRKEDAMGGQTLDSGGGPSGRKYPGSRVDPPPGFRVGRVVRHLLGRPPLELLQGVVRK